MADEQLTEESENENETGNNPADNSASSAQGNDPSDDATEESEDKHGQPGISRGKYVRDLAKKDAEIEELRKQIEAAAKTDESRKELEAKIEELKQGQDDMRIDYELKLAGCRNVKAAKALLADHEGDVAKLKDAEPWMFEVKQTGSTGFKGNGGTDTVEERRAKARQAAGLPAKKE